MLVLAKRQTETIFSLHCMAQCGVYIFTFRELSAERGLESKWEYMGYGIWENRDGDEVGSGDSPPPVRRWSAERGIQSMERGSHSERGPQNIERGGYSQHTSNSIKKSFQSSLFNGNHVDDNGTSASTATAGQIIFINLKVIILTESCLAK